MLRPNNPALDLASLSERLSTVAAELRASGAVEKRRNERSSEDASLRGLLVRLQGVDALLDRVEELNQFQAPIPRLAQRLPFGKKAAQFLLRAFNHLLREQRDLNAAQARALRELTAVTLALTKRLIELERDPDR